MKGIFLQILFAFKRDAVFVCTTLLTLICSGFAFFLGSNAVVETQEAKIVYTAGFSRVAIIAGFLIFIIFYIKQMFENREIEVILSRSISRTKVLIAMFFGFSVVLLTLIIPIITVLIMLKTNLINTIIWCCSVYFEGILVISFALCCSLILNSFIHSLSACFVMYISGRIIGNFTAYLTLSTSTELTAILGSVLKVLSLFIPRLDLFGKTSWLIYGDFSLNDIVLFTSQALVFCSIFLCIASIDLKRKNF